MKRKSPVEPDPTAIGEVSSPPLAHLPDPASLFSIRAMRLRQLAEASDLAPYLRFLAGLADAQHQIQAELPPPESPNPAVILRAREFEMPPLHRNGMEGDETVHAIFDRLFAAADAIDKPQAAAEALTRVAGADPKAHLAMAETVLSGALPADAIAEHIFVWAALQVHFARLASVLDAGSLTPVADGICPVCGGRPASSMVVGWPGSHGARFCCCSLCSTLWHYVRIKCVLCGSTKGIGYREIENHGGFVKAETCDECQGWTKIFYQNKAPAVEPVADDVASLGLDLLMREGRYRRGGFAPLLAGF
ncbi:formate dehydrogenase accessory protein FdhE [Sinorhizobium alkalisoli]|uniref:Protein FdhE homolog n=1 Tax=Sinorhizobium alkalisoli TaxID=1752398 RepID=A0A1E3VCK9_9HYPH|nr:formate dehydrogenase accessory protein FdhE [Sinorhizobium alkalisoli]MCA1493511.1 formate dehydrogenase accessory protein FdhE [Ensifer sp. NBAIM29]MCG5480888.1 formate dehydrogenase accessory protein FdhE [Sinorhizobium alkalisoli]ODR91313.1 formate dehydrogenase accessory protein FdhE [Sinorhizobium alkalisoli]QFI66599.1 formate dehydrogenase formation protein FdhE [Sinorhizobium alkalisoli]